MRKRTKPKEIIINGIRIDLKEALREGVDGKEICVGCFHITDVDVKSNVERRTNFVEPVGQLCPSCKIKYS